MDSNDYLIDWLVRERLADAQNAASRAALIAVAHPSRGPLRVTLGTALIRLGRRLADAPTSATTVTAS
jgi:hypothetical protein